MERLAAHAVAATAIAAAIAMAPLTTQHTSADDSPSAAAAVLTTPGATPLPTKSASPSAPPVSHGAMAPSAVPCSDAHQVGPTAYAYYNNAITFSVKLYYSPDCNAYYGYAFPWLQFRNTGVTYSVGMAVYDVTKDGIDGARTYQNGSGGPDFWSQQVAAVHGDCVEGTAHVFYPNWETDTYTVKYCG